MLKIALIGFGTVGQSVARILCDGTHERLSLAVICNRHVERKKADWVPPGIVWTSDIGDVLRSEVDVVVELIGGEDPATEWIRQSLEAGKSVVTGNKQVIAHSGASLIKVAARHGCHLLFEAAVAGGIPVIRGVQEGLAGDKLLRLSALLNGTCNFILTRMEADNISFADALKEAQTRGFAESDPTADVDGADAQAKLAILSAVGLGFAALERAATYAKDRQVFNRPIGRNQAIQHPLAINYSELEAAWLMIMKAAWEYDSGLPCGVSANTAKYLAGEAGYNACQTAVMTHGGFGYAKEYHVERYLRESLIPRIAPVSPQLALCFIAEKALGLPKSY